MTRLIAIQGAVWLGMLLAAGPLAFALAAASGFIGILLLETVNYIEHYGLLRDKEDNGRYERCKPHHSWNANYIFSNLVLFHLERHSDHHANPGRRYAMLRHFDEAPQLPTGYPGMILLATVPPLFFRVMDPLVERAAEARAAA